VANWDCVFVWKKRIFMSIMYCMLIKIPYSRRMRWAGHVARMGEERGCIGSWWGNRRE